MLQRTSMPAAPWYLIPADEKRFRDVLVARVVTETLERMDPRYPGPPPELEALRKALRK
jgi:polyphosphate kinase 2 (PPK2 family)